MDKLYTCILQFEGGTYVSQVRAQDVNAAQFAWAKNLPLSEIEGLTEEIRDEILEEVGEDYNEPVLLDGMQNAWCADLSIGEYYLSLNFVETVG